MEMKLENKWYPLHEAERSSGCAVLPARCQHVVGDLTPCLMPAKIQGVIFFKEKYLLSICVQLFTYELDYLLTYKPTDLFTYLYTLFYFRKQIESINY